MLVSSLMAEWSKAPSVELLVVTGSDPALANDYLFAVYSSLYDHSETRNTKIKQSFLR